MTRPYVALLALLVVLTACGDTADDAGSGTATTDATPATPPTGPTTAEPVGADLPPVAAYVAWLAGLAAHDAAAACDRHAPGFTIELRQRAILEGRAEQGDACEGFVAILWESPGLETDPVDVEVTQRTDEDALLAADFPVVDQTVRMVNRYGSWYVAATTAREEGPGQWLDAWCDLGVGTGREEAIAAMGEPSGEYTLANGGEPQLWWASGPYDFRAYLDPEGTVTELVADHDALTAEDRARLDCPELRNRTNS